MAVVVLIAFASVMCEAIIAATTVFNPLYARPIVDGYSILDTGNATYLRPSPGEGRCVSLCALTPGCLWVSVAIDTGVCNMSDAICPQFVQNPRSQTTMLLPNVVINRNKHTDMFVLATIKQNICNLPRYKVKTVFYLRSKAILQSINSDFIGCICNFVLHIQMTSGIISPGDIDIAIKMTDIPIPSSYHFTA